MIVEELAARFNITVQGIEHVRRAIAWFQRLQKLIAAIAAVAFKRLGRMTGLLARLGLGAAAMGTAFATSAALIKAAAMGANLALAGLAAGFARLKKGTSDTALLKGVNVQELALVENLMQRVGASAKDGRKWLGEFADKVREGAREGGDWADALGKQGVRLKQGKKGVKGYGDVLDQIMRAADKIKDPGKKRDFLNTALEGAPDEFIAQLIGTTSAFKKWQELVKDTRKLGGVTSLGDVLNAQDITGALDRIQLAIKGFVEAFGSGLMASFAADFRSFAQSVASIATDENRDKVRKFAGAMTEFFGSINKGGSQILSSFAEALGSLTAALGRIDDATGGKLKMLGEAMAGLLIGGGIGALARAHPIMAIATAITGLMWLLGELDKWKSTGESPLAGFFQAIADGARQAQEAVQTLVTTMKELFNFGGQSTPGAPQQRRPMTPSGLWAPDGVKPPSGESLIEQMQRFIQKLPGAASTLSPERSANQIQRDRVASSGGTEVNAPISATATFNGIFDKAAADKVQAMIDASIAKIPSQIRQTGGLFGGTTVKGGNTTTGTITAP